MTAELSGGPILFVLHGDVICALLHHLLQFPNAEIHQYLVQQCSLTELRREGDGYAMTRFNQVIAG